MVASSRRAFGIAPLTFTAELTPKEGAKRIEHRVLGGVRTAGATVGAGVGAVARGAKRAVTSKRKKSQAAIEALPTETWSAPATAPASSSAPNFFIAILLVTVSAYPIS